MNIYYRLEDIPAQLSGGVVTIGSFDGVHRGHQKIIEQVCRAAQQAQRQSIVVTFEPHPRLVLPNKQEEPVQLLTTLDEKAYWLERYSVDNLVVVPFDLNFANQSPAAYVQDFLVARLKPSQLIIGYDHRFGHRRAGGIEYLREMAPSFGYAVEEIPAQDIDDIKISSTEIRRALRMGDARRALHLLGHPFQLSGPVVKGQQIGRTIGFPTANLDFAQGSHKLIPKEGIYSAGIRVHNRNYKGMLYIGRRPTIDQALPPSVEVNIFDFQQDIYGEHITIDVLNFLREDSKFGDLQALKLQLQRDKIQALASLADIKL